MMDRIKKRTLIRIATVTVVGTLCLGGFLQFVMPVLAKSGPPQKDMVVDKLQRNRVLEAAISNLNRYYVFPEKAAAMEKQLHQQMQQGTFDSVTSAEKLAETMTEVLQRDSKDKHLEVRYFEEVLPDQDDTPEQKAAEALHEQRFNYGFANVGRLKGNIGLIELHSFSRPQGTADRIAASMALLADTKALIIDLRHCGGGDPETVMLFASYLYDKRTHLNDIYWRDENRTEERWTTDSVPGKRYGESRLVYILTSEETFSGGEDFAYALKNNKRATLVGETTGGGAHAGNPRRLGDHFMMFVPTGRPINPVTHTDWEGVGVTPNIKTSADNAQTAAHIAILKTLIASEKDPDWKERMQHTVADLD